MLFPQPKVTTLLHVSLACLLLSQLTSNHARSLEEWRTRSIYQIVTDRFATSGPPPLYCDLTTYCGGSFTGIIQKLGYIKRLGFDAIWISPVVTNMDHGYHGYWAKDIFSINHEFGTPAQLKTLVKAAHALGIWVMVDVVANHMGPVADDFSQFVPFNSARYFHDCSICGEFCEAEDSGNATVVEHCRLFGLPDLNQSVPYVRDELIGWITGLIAEFHFDGIRIDTMPYVPIDFWRDFSAAAGVFSMGEVFDGRVEVLAQYLGNAADSLVDYPTFYTLRDVFQQKQSMSLIPYRRGQQRDFFQDVRVFGTFVENHDNPRFLHDQKDKTLYRNAIAYVMLGEGIPIVYYGTEQEFKGGEDPENREPLWTSKYLRRGKTYKFLRALNMYRQGIRIWENRHEELHVNDNCYVFTRGTTLVALTNVGSKVGTSFCTFALPGCYRWRCGLQVHPYRQDRVCSVSFDGPQATVTFTNGEPVVLEVLDAVDVNDNDPDDG